MNTSAVSTFMNNVASNTSTNNSTNSTSSANSDKDLFMKLLVAQLKNQDPLQPQDGAAFVAQLAQFNSLEQLTGIRQSIDELVNRLQ